MNRNKTPRRCVFLLVVVAVIILYATIHVTRDNRIRILCVGDIITLGSVGLEDEINYRYWLWKMLYDAGVADDFVFVGDNTGAMLRSTDLNRHDLILPVTIPPYKAGAGGVKLTEEELDAKMTPPADDGRIRSTLRFKDSASSAAPRAFKRHMGTVSMDIPLMHNEGVSWDELLANASWPIAAQRHEGHLGWSIKQLATAVPDMIYKHKPNVILALMGIVDLLHLHKPSDLIAHLNEFITRAMRSDPDVFIYVAKPYPLHGGAGDTYARGDSRYWLTKEARVVYVQAMDEYRERFDAMMKRLESRPKESRRGRIIVVDMAHKWSEFHSYDGVRPNEYGSKLLAARWMEELQPHIASGFTKNYVQSRRDYTIALQKASIKASTLNKDVIKCEEEKKDCTCPDDSSWR
eukprot:TRINITY_DN17339_c0_g1_i1.p1 TRINITY_DN17339_c0_g1~~TRINITY_DN17339_c0_g1_i1.p1  ORF type:complete len:458 (-),score=63.80 TRINITY_DN17339_c0_g1_i1:87-1304(-)